MNRFRFKLAVLLALVMVLTASLAWAGGYADVKKAGKLLVKGKYDAAIAKLDAAIACGKLTKEGLAIAYNYRGLANLKKKCCEAAVADFTKAINLIPQYGAAYYNRAMAYKCLCNEACAKKDLAMFEKYKKAFGVAPGAPKSLKGKPYADCPAPCAPACAPAKKACPCPPAKPCAPGVTCNPKYNPKP